MELFRTNLNHSIGNLKEKKYLRPWIQAAFIFSLVWSFGSLLDSAERLTFEARMRDLLTGKVADHPLPTVLNNKCDAIPPLEGSLFDFVFDFKARGQWKHWADFLKNSEQSAAEMETGFIPTIETARYEKSIARTTLLNSSFKL